MAFGAIPDVMLATLARGDGVDVHGFGMVDVWLVRRARVAAVPLSDAAGRFKAARAVLDRLPRHPIQGGTGHHAPLPGHRAFVDGSVPFDRIPR